MSLGALKTLHEEASVQVPDAHALVQGASSNVLRIGGNGHGRDTILNRQRQRVGTILNVPKSDGSVARAGSDRASVASKVERVNVLLVTVEVVANGSRVDIPHLTRLALADLKIRQRNLLG